MKLFGAPRAGAAPWLMAALMAGLLTALPAVAQTVSAPYGETRDWQVYAVSHQGSFLRCGATPMGDMAQIAVEYSQEGWALAVPVTAAQDELPGTLQIDRASFDGRFYSGTGSLIWFLSDAALAALRKGSDLVATPQGMPAQQIGLTGSAAAMLKVEECHANGGAVPQAAAKASGRPVPPGVRVWPQDAAAQPVESDAADFGAGCPAWGQYASGPSEVAAKARFMNKSDRAVTIYWLDFKGLPVEYAALLPGEEFRADTFEGHVWIAKDFAGACLGGGALFPRQGKKNKFELK